MQDTYYTAGAWTWWTESRQKSKKTNQYFTTI